MGKLDKNSKHKNEILSFEEAKYDNENIRLILTKRNYKNSIKTRLKKSIELDPYNYLLYLRYIKLCISENSFLETEIYLQKVLSLPKYDESAIFELIGDYSFSQRLYENAKNRYLEAYYSNPNSSFNIMLKLGYVNLFLDEDYEAEKWFTNCTKIFKNSDLSPHLELAKIKMSRNEYKEAEMHIKKYLDSNSEIKAIGHIEMSKIKIINEEKSEAEKHFIKYMEASNPRNDNERNTKIAYYNHCLNRENEAIVFYRKVKTFTEYETRDDEKVITHISKHYNIDNDNVKNCGIFNNSFSLSCLRNLVLINSDLKQLREYVDVYNIYFENCGYKTLENGYKKQLDYLTIVTVPFSNKIITAYPSDKIIEQKPLKCNGKQLILKL